MNFDRVVSKRYFLDKEQSTEHEKVPQNSRRNNTRLRVVGATDPNVVQSRGIETTITIGAAYLTRQQQSPSAKEALRVKTYGQTEKLRDFGGNTHP